MPHEQTIKPSAAVATQTPTAAATTVAPTVADTAAPTTAATATQQPVDTTDRALYVISMSTVLSNLTAAEFNGTAFGLAVTDTTAAKYTTDGITVSIPASGVTAALAAVRKLRRRLQAATPTSSVAVAYDVQHITGAQNAANIQAWLASTEANSLLTERYRQRSASVVAATATTAVRDPQPETVGNGASSGSSTPIGLIVGVVLGVLALLVLAVMWCKRKALSRCCMRTKQRDPTDQPLHTSSGGDSSGALVRDASAYSSVRTVPTPLKRRLSSSSQALEPQDDIERSMQAAAAAGHSSSSSYSMSMASVADSSSNSLSNVVNSHVIKGMDRGAALQRDAHHDSVVLVADTQQQQQQRQSQQQQQAVSVDKQPAAAAAATRSSKSSSSSSAVATAPVVITGAIVAQGSSAARISGTITTAADSGKAMVAVVDGSSDDSALPRKTSMTDKAAEVAKNVTSSITSVLKKGAENHGAAVVTGTTIINTYKCAIFVDKCACMA
jgi:hypothetical protein